MKRIFLLLVIVFAYSCKNEVKIEKKTIKPIAVDKYKHLYGNWVGDFIADSVNGDYDEYDYAYSNKINILLKKIEGNKASGVSIVSGNKRPIFGDFKKEDSILVFKLFEPGDDKNDGIFEFKITTDKLSGKWISKNKNAKVYSRLFELKKQDFKYNPKLQLPKDNEYVDWYSSKIDSTKEVVDGVEETYYNEFYRSASDVITKINASTQKLTENDLKNLKKLELEIIRNTIFARHGYTFKKKSYRQFFDPVDWYVPISNDVSNELTLLEKENIKLLNRFEKYAEENYDTFGR